MQTLESVLADAKGSDEKAKKAALAQLERLRPTWASLAKRRPMDAYIVGVNAKLTAP